MGVQSITPQQLNDAIKAGKQITLIDVRTPMEFQELHVSCAKNTPLDRLDANAIAAERRSTSEPLYVICRSGGRGKQACEKLIAGGLANVINIEGGTLACDQAGLPVVRGKKVMSLERQVRIAAGGLVFLGSMLGYFVHHYFIGLPIFVGAGLVFAGVTDTCAMGMLIAKMPWNRLGTACET